MAIGGNITASLQKKTSTGFNEIGERIPAWVETQSILGFLDLSSGDSKYGYNAKIQESTHLFICDYTNLDRKTDDKRLVVNGLIFDVLLIDDPMELHQHLEIHLKLVGDVDG